MLCWYSKGIEGRNVEFYSATKYCSPVNHYHFVTMFSELVTIGVKLRSLLYIVFGSNNRQKAKSVVSCPSCMSHKIQPRRLHHLTDGRNFGLIVTFSPCSIDNIAYTTVYKISSVFPVSVSWSCHTWSAIMKFDYEPQVHSDKICFILKRIKLSLVPKSFCLTFLTVFSSSIVNVVVFVFLLIFGS